MEKQVMHITKKYADNSGYEVLDKQQAIDFLEDRGYYKPGTVNQIQQDLLNGAKETKLRTPWAFYTFQLA